MIKQRNDNIIKFDDNKLKDFLNAFSRDGCFIPIYKNLSSVPNELINHC